jgi:hypothetical protein
LKFKTEEVERVLDDLKTGLEKEKENPATDPFFWTRLRRELESLWTKTVNAENSIELERCYMDWRQKREEAVALFSRIGPVPRDSELGHELHSLSQYLAETESEEAVRTNLGSLRWSTPTEFVGDPPSIRCIIDSDVDPEVMAEFFAELSSIYAELSDGDELIIREAKLPVVEEAFA